MKTKMPPIEHLRDAFGSCRVLLGPKCETLWGSSASVTGLCLCLCLCHHTANPQFISEVAFGSVAFGCLQRVFAYLCGWPPHSNLYTPQADPNGPRCFVQAFQFLIPSSELQIKKLVTKQDKWNGVVRGRSIQFWTDKESQFIHNLILILILYPFAFVTTSNINKL